MEPKWSFFYENEYSTESRHHYSRFCQEAKNLIDFNIATGLALFTDRRLSDRLWRSFHIAVPYSMSFGFLTSNQLPLLERRAELEPATSSSSHMSTHELEALDSSKRDYSVYRENGLVWIDEKAHPSRAAKTSEHEQPAKPPWHPAYLLYGRIFEDGRLEGLASFRRSPGLQFELSAMNAWHTFSSSVHAILQYNRFRNAKTSSEDASGWFSELSYQNATDEDNPHWLGCRSVLHFPRSRALARLKLSLGGELYYAAKEKSGGVSLGIRAAIADRADGRTASSIVTLIANPIMGHLSSSYVKLASPRLLLAARYDFNMYSFESDLAFGLELSSHPVRPSLEAHPASSLKLRAGLSQGVGLQFSSQLTEHSHVKFGLASGPRLELPKTTFGIEINC